MIGYNTTPYDVIYLKKQQDVVTDSITCKRQCGNWIQIHNIKYFSDAERVFLTTVNNYELEGE